MNIVNSRSLAIPDIKVVEFARFSDGRGYFTETYRKSDVARHLSDSSFVQCNESFSRAGVIRGLHFQWNPFMGKMVRTVSGHMLDIVLDIRRGSPTYGKALLHEMKSNVSDMAGEWIFIPSGFAHGNCFLTDTVIEYLCTGEYSQSCEAGISPLANDIDWSLCDMELKRRLDSVVASGAVITEKDRSAFSVASWTNDVRANVFSFN